MRYVAAVDPGFMNTGIVIFDISHGDLQLVDSMCIVNKKIKDKNAYVSELDAKLINNTMDKAVMFLRSVQLERIVFELPTGGAKSSRASRALGIATAMCVYLPEMLECEYKYTTPRAVKIAATGDPFAEKDAIIKAMTALYPKVGQHLKKEQEHIADAIGVALAEREWLCNQG